jgi:hypothetical protein
MAWPSVQLFTWLRGGSRGLTVCTTVYLAERRQPWLDRLYNCLPGWEETAMAWPSVQLFTWLRGGSHGLTVCTTVYLAERRQPWLDRLYNCLPGWDEAAMAGTSAALLKPKPRFGPGTHCYIHRSLWKISVLLYNIYIFKNIVAPETSAISSNDSSSFASLSLYDTN